MRFPNILWLIPNIWHQLSNVLVTIPNVLAGIPNRFYANSKLKITGENGKFTVYKRRWIHNRNTAESLKHAHLSSCMNDIGIANRRFAPIEMEVAVAGIGKRTTYAYIRYRDLLTDLQRSRADPGCARRIIYGKAPGANALRILMIELF